MSGTYDSKTGLIYFTIAESNGFPAEHYHGVASGIFHDPAVADAAKCPRLVLVPEGVGRQLLLHPSGSTVSRASEGALTSFNGPQRHWGPWPPEAATFGRG
jgi:hypothetical protein